MLVRLHLQVQMDIIMQAVLGIVGEGVQVGRHRALTLLRRVRGDRAERVRTRMYRLPCGSSSNNSGEGDELVHHADLFSSILSLRTRIRI